MSDERRPQSSYDSRGGQGRSGGPSRSSGGGGRPGYSGGRRSGGGGGGYSNDREESYDDRRGGRGGRFQQRRRRVCAFCLEKTEHIDYKDVQLLRRYVSEQGKIRSRRKGGTCARHQRMLAVAIKRARHIALLPYTSEHIRQY